MTPGFSAFLLCTSAIAMAEIGDKTQFLAMTLAARAKKPVTVLLGIFLATFINNALAAALGHLVTATLGETFLRWVVGIGLLAMAAWMLLPEKEEDVRVRNGRLGVFGTAFLSFFLAELADKTQIATMALSARYADYYWYVVAGTTLGMMLVNIPAVLIGERAMRFLPMRLVHIIA
ncbi:MAG TPA: TMEM165/GDT1 family protein, partial [Alphaproteobacteria bacterium]|nr:TMEM165/GDT1 family protein [Alphaproteobacteria bacterium]